MEWLSFALYKTLTDAFSRLCHTSEPYRRNECLDFPNLCKNGRCVDTEHSYRCECYDGYAISQGGVECEGKGFVVKGSVKNCY